jgi:hypothetical protein
LAGVHYDLAALTRHRVRREENAGDVSGHHFLYDDGDRHFALIDPPPPPVSDGPIRPERSPAVPDGPHHRFLAVHIQKRVLLPGKGRAGQIFGSGAGTDCHSSPSQRRISPGYFHPQSFRHGRLGEQRADGGAVGTVFM